MIREALTFSVLATAPTFAVAECQSNSHASQPAGIPAESATARVLYVHLRPSEEDIALWTAQGRAAAQRDLAAGRLVQLLWGLQMPHEAYDAALARRGISGNAKTPGEPRWMAWPQGVAAAEDNFG